MCTLSCTFKLEMAAERGWPFSLCREAQVWRLAGLEGHSALEKPLNFTLSVAQFS